VVYEQLHEVGMMTDEARGAGKRPEDLRWLWNFGRSQRERFGRAYVEFGEPFPLPEPSTGAHPVERVALEVCHRINRATPVTTTAVVCLALLSADRSMTLDEVLATVDPLARYLARRGRPVAGAADLTDRATVRHALDDLVRSGVLAAYDGGTDTVWGIAPGRHLVAAFYRNTAVHVLVDRAIGELGLLAAAEGGEDAPATANRETLRLRDLLKFDFFFPSRRQFAEEMLQELALVEPGREGGLRRFDPADALRWLEHAEPLVAHLVLRPYLEAYSVVADRLAAWPEDEVLDEAEFLRECLRVGRQWVLQRRLASEESVSLELFKPALQLARRRDLVAPGGTGLSARRAAFRDELAALVRRVETIADLARRAASRPV
jgi:glycerol-3-phosphate O-acyltransferase